MLVLQCAAVVIAVAMVLWVLLYAGILLVMVRAYRQEKARVEGVRNEAV